MGPQTITGDDTSESSGSSGSSGSSAPAADQHQHAVTRAEEALRAAEQAEAGCITAYEEAATRADAAAMLAARRRREELHEEALAARIAHARCLQAVATAQIARTRQEADAAEAAFHAAQGAVASVERTRLHGPAAEAVQRQVVDARLTMSAARRAYAEAMQEADRAQQALDHLITGAAAQLA